MIINFIFKIIILTENHRGKPEEQGGSAQFDQEEHAHPSIGMWFDPGLEKLA